MGICDCDGVNVGSRDGATVGSGDTVGLCDCDGAIVGSCVGNDVGVGVVGGAGAGVGGCEIGGREPTNVGTGVGNGVGDEVGRGVLGCVGDVGAPVRDGVSNGVGDCVRGCFVDVSGVGDAVLVGAPVIVGSKDGAAVGVMGMLMGMLINPNQLTPNNLENSASSDSAGSSPVGSCNPTLIKFRFRRALRRSVFPVACTESTASRAVPRIITTRDSFMVKHMQYYIFKPLIGANETLFCFLVVTICQFLLELSYRTYP